MQQKYGKMIKKGAFLVALALCAGQAKGTLADGSEIESKNVYEISVIPGTDAKSVQSYLDMNLNGQYDELVVKFMAGDYYFDRTIYVNSNTKLVFAEGAKIHKQKAYGAVLEGRLTNDDGGYDGCVNVTIDGGIWDATAIMNQDGGTETMRFIHASNITIQNAEFSNISEGSHFIVLAGVEKAAITKCSFHGYGDNGDDTLVPKEAVQLDIPHDATIVPTKQEVYWDDLPCKDIVVSECEFYDFSRAIGSHMAVAGVYHENIKILNNTIRDMSEVAIKLYQYKDTIVSDNKIDNCAGGIVIYTELGATDENAYLQPLGGKVTAEPEKHNLTITNNTVSGIYENEGFGDAVRLSATEQLPMSGVVVSGNTISNVARYGIFATQTSEAEVLENKISQTGKHGILLEENSENAVITQNEVTAPGESGIAVYTGSDSAKISTNVIEQAKESGLYLYLVSNCTVGVSETDYNTITNPGIGGIYITTESNDNTVEYNVITNAGGDGIWVYASEGNLLANNTISAGEDGFDINTNSKNTVVKDNRITSAGANGIWLSSGSTSGTISGNTIEKYAAKTDKCYGIGVYQSGGTQESRTVIRDNKITGVGKSTTTEAIRISTSDYMLVENNILDHPTGDGIYIYQSKYGEITKNTITSPKNSGIYITTESDSNKITNNTITAAATDGIWVYASSGNELANNTISAGEDGFDINTNSKNTVVKDNRITSAGANGIWLSSGSTSGTISGNTIEKYAVKADKCYGIGVYQSGGTKENRTYISGNTITGTGKSTTKEAIRVSTSDYMSVDNNIIKNPTGDGIYIYQSKYGEITKNTITSPKKSGIYITTASDSNQITDNKITGAAIDGIWVYSSIKNTITGNTISAGQDGIDVNTDSKKTVIKKNTITSAGANGIWLASGSTSSTISSNTIKKYATKVDKKYAIGVYLSGGTSKSRTVISSNKITGTGKSTTREAIRVSTSDYVTIKSNTIKKATGYGIYIYQSKYNTVTSNKITSPTKGGIYATTACDKISIQKNTVSKPKDVAIMIYQAPNSTVASNKVTTTSNYPGIRISQSNNTSIKKNTVTGAQAKKEIWITGSTDCTESKNTIK